MSQEELDPRLSGRRVHQVAPHLRPRSELGSSQSMQPMTPASRQRGIGEARLAATANAYSGDTGTRSVSAAELAQWRAARRVVVVPDVPAFGAAPSSSAPFIAATQQVEFQQDGYIIGAVFGIRSLGSFQNALGVKLETVGKGQGITTDGETAVFMAANLLCGDDPVSQICPLVRRVRANDRINVTFCNYINNANLQPSGTFFFLRDCDLPDGCDPEAVGTLLPGATRLLQVPIQNNLANQLAPGTTGAPGVVVMPAHGLLVGLRALDTAYSLATGPNATLELWMQVEDLQGNQEALTTDGRSVAFAPVSHLSSGPDQCFHILRRVRLNDRYRVTFKNRSTVTEAINFAPQATFFLRADEDVMSRGLLG